jgi:hypothetical protein
MTEFCVNVPERTARRAILPWPQQSLRHSLKTQSRIERELSVACCVGNAAEIRLLQSQYGIYELRVVQNVYSIHSEFESFRFAEPNALY